MPHKQFEKLLIVIVFIVVAFYCVNLYGQSALHGAEKYWHWTADAAHHDAVVKVRQGPYGGTGTLITHAGYYWIATASHVVENGNRATVTWPARQYTVSASVYKRDRHADLAVLTVKPPQNPVAIPLATAMPPVGSIAEICGYGGPIAPLRHFHAKIRSKLPSHSYGISLESCVISGDSGGGIVWQGQFIGVISGGPYRTRGLQARRGGSWSLVHPASGGNCIQLAGILPYAQPAITQPQPIR